MNCSRHSVASTQRPRFQVQCAPCHNFRKLRPCLQTVAAGRVFEPVEFPASLPVILFKASEVLTPGASKMLHLYERKYLDMMEEVMASEHQTFVHAVVETGRDNAAGRLPGSYVVDDFVLCLACLVQVQSVKPVGKHGQLVRVRGEARVKLTNVDVSFQNIRGTVQPLPDRPLSDMAAAQRQAAQLRQVMRDVQNLSMKFYSEETANLQQAMTWANSHQVLARSGQTEATSHRSRSLRSSSSHSTSTTSRPDYMAIPHHIVPDQIPDHVIITTAANAHTPPQQFYTPALESPAMVYDTSSSSTSSSSAMSSSSSSSSSMSSSSPSSSAFHGSQLQINGSSSGQGMNNSGMNGSRVVMASGYVWDDVADGSEMGDHMDPRCVADVSRDAEGLHRLSFAALQVLPHASKQEREDVARQRVLAMELCDTSARMAAVTEMMTQQRNSLAAKCALKSLNLPFN